MAEGVHHIDGAPALLVATVGPGAMNCVNVVANAMQDRVPLIVLSGAVDAADALSYTHQVMDHRKVFEPITKASFTLSAEAADVIADKAIAIATEGRPGPVHIDIPISVAEAPAGDRGRARCAESPVVPAVAPLTEARAWLGAARRPLIVAGLDILYDDAAGALRAFVEATGVPVITTYKAKGVLAEDHPLALGAAGLSPLADRHLLPLVARADLVIAVGYDPIEMRPGWRDAWDAGRTRVIDIAAAPNRHYMHHAGLSILADTGETLAALREGHVKSELWPDGEIAATRLALSEAFPTDDAWGPAAVIDECRNALPDTAIATVDSGAHRILLSQMWRCREPRTLLQSSGFCTMGCAVPLAIGAKIAAPERQVVSFCGDAGLLMVAGELATAAELGQNTIFVVFVDRSLALIELKQRQRQLPNLGVDFAAHDYAAIGQAFGGHGATVTDRAGLRAALAQASDARCFTLIAALIEPGAYDGRI